MEGRNFKFICTGCKVNVTCFCSRKNCKETHDICPICEFIKIYKPKPVKGSIKDRKDWHSNQNAENTKNFQSISL